MRRAVEFFLNGEPTTIDVDTRRPLLWVLRTELGLTGTKYGCGERQCGACTVLVDGRPTRSCGARVGSVQGRRVTTIEGLAGTDGALHPVQRAFAEHGALQCGFCTPGMILSAVGFLNRNADPSPQEIVEGLEGNLCRCSTYNRVLEAVQSAARELQTQEASS
jgi:aerobic-type carbon monoxide dehydrogenase small subunit (CoxS/CutS family)